VKNICSTASQRAKCWLIWWRN